MGGIITLLGRLASGPCITTIAERNPNIAFAPIGVRMGASTIEARRCGPVGTLDGVTESDEEGTEDGDGSEDYDEPHLREDPSVE